MSDDDKRVPEDIPNPTVTHMDPLIHELRRQLIEMIRLVDEGELEGVAYVKQFKDGSADFDMVGYVHEVGHFTDCMEALQEVLEDIS